MHTTEHSNINEVNRAVQRRTVVRGAAWAVPVMAGVISTPLAAASGGETPPAYDLELVSLITPGQSSPSGNSDVNRNASPYSVSNTSGYSSTTEGHRNFLENQYVYFEVVYRNNGPDAAPAGSELQLRQQVGSYAVPLFQNFGVHSPGDAAGTITTSQGNALSFGSISHIPVVASTYQQLTVVLNEEIQPGDSFRLIWWGQIREVPSNGRPGYSSGDSSAGNDVGAFKTVLWIAESSVEDETNPGNNRRVTGDWGVQRWD